MWDEERPTEELLDQIAATRAALSSLAVAVVRDASEARLTAVPATDSSDNLDEALALVDRLLRCR
jgi:DNA-binding FrmR family transcriptional regulator